MRAKGPLLLLITAMLWGMAFVAQTTAAQNVEPFTFNFSRNFIGVAFLSGVIAYRRRAGQDRRPDERDSGYTKRTLIIAGIACGVVLCASSVLQQAGITSYPEEAAASGRSGFLTALYMVIVAVLGIFMGKKPHVVVFVAVGVALLGMYLLCVPNGISNIYYGDGLVLASALGYALHIIVIDKYK
ncbi:MAG: DMT family transporter [Coriobacteriales bacterium]|nr:DMT family transporter [Coriobacteriales bacterium]